ncbi:tail completion protein gp17 [Oceaniradius stylonematis]|uniref:tail completion protein gp17 n=1 Tax=Oceaniradius stylonematis TaxID=2184161 RepID=UPI00273FE069|nr:hypothetical protein [Oceaniradius stylonematis]
MDLLKALYDLLESGAAYQTLRRQTYVEGLPVNPILPCVLLKLTSGTDGFTHQGPHGLSDDLVRVYSIALSANEAAGLARAVHNALQGYAGDVGNVSIQLIQHQSRNSDYGETGDTYRQIDSYRVHLTRA